MDMSITDSLNAGPALNDMTPSASAQNRRLVNAVWQPFVQFKLLMYMLGSTAVVAVLLGTFLYFAFSDLIAVVSSANEGTGYYGEMIEIQLVHVFRYCGALFVLYIALLAAVCIAYTHRLVGPFRPFTRHIEALTQGDYSSRVNLRKGDLDMHTEHAERLNALAAELQRRDAGTSSQT
jgi:nitrogen fixation/metabolism regulation signal transduction histidine kinase